MEFVVKLVFAIIFGYLLFRVYHVVRHTKKKRKRPLVRIISGLIIILCGLFLDLLFSVSLISSTFFFFDNRFFFLVPLVIGYLPGAVLAIQGICGLIDDIPILQKKVDKLQGFSQFYEHLLNSLDDPVFVKDREHRWVFLNDAACRMFGKSGDALIGNSDDAVFGEKDAKVQRKLDDLVFSSGETNIHEGTVFLNFANRTISTKKSLIRIPRYASEYICGTIRDTTSRKKMEESLRSSEERFRAIFENAADGIFIKDRSSKYILANPGMEKIFGMPASEFIGKTDAELFNGGIGEKIRKSDLFVLDGKILEEERTKKVGGETRVFNTIITPLYEKSGKVNGIFGISRDITRMKRLESRILHSQKMEAISTLAGGIAHQFNNALNGITGNIELLQLKIPDPQPIQKNLDAMKESSERMIHLTEMLFAFAGESKNQRHCVRIENLVKSTLSLLKYSIAPEIRIITLFSTEKGLVNVDLAQIQLVLTSVLNNALEAIKNQGTINISVTDARGENEVMFDGTSPEKGNYICVRIQDNGCGMCEETRKKMFDPFFSTKFKGRGLGMAAVYGIVRNHEGWITVDSEKGEGTSVNIYLPECSGIK